MKKILFLATILLSLNTVTSAQVSVTEDNEIKNFRFGLKGDMSLDWLNVDNKKKFANGGVGVGFDWGMQLEFRLNKTLSVMTGLSLKYNSFKLDYSSASSADSVYYMLNSNEEFIDFNAGISSDTNAVTADLYNLRTRAYKANYVNIPLVLKMKTSEIGYLTYFGQFGLNVGIKTGAKVNDDVTKVNYSSVDSTQTFAFESGSSIKDKLNLSSGIQPIRLGLVIGGGAEYNFSGSTSMFFALHYNHYFTNMLRAEKNEDFLRSYDAETTSFEAVAAKVVPGSVTLTVGILF